MPPKRVRLSGSAYKKMRKKRIMEEEKLVGSLEAFIVKTKKSESCVLNEDLVSGSEDDHDLEEEDSMDFSEESDRENKEDNDQEVKHGINFEGAAEAEYIQRGDFGLIPLDHLTSEDRDNLVSIEAENFQNSKGPFATGTKGRKMTEAWFYRKLADGKGEILKRTWLLYSLSTKAAYCFCCVLFRILHRMQFPSSSHRKDLMVEGSGRTALQ